MGDIDKELVAGTHGIGQVERRRRVAFHQNVIGRTGQAIYPHHHYLREAIRALDEVTVGIGSQ
ncbi:hypothetical protein D3C87_2161870 [compost metagenome]